MANDNLRDKNISKDNVNKLERGKDVSNLFARAFVRHDLQAAAEAKGGYYLYNQLGQPVALVTPHGVQHIAQPGMPTGAAPSVPMAPPMAKSTSSKPDFRSIGAHQSKGVEEQNEKDRALDEFIRTITESELQNLRDLSSDRMLVSEAKVKQIHANGEEVGVERMIDLDLVRWEKFDGMMEFRITPLGRRVLEHLSR